MQCERYDNQDESFSLGCRTLAVFMFAQSSLQAARRGGLVGIIVANGLASMARPKRGLENMAKAYQLKLRSLFRGLRRRKNRRRLATGLIVGGLLIIANIMTQPEPKNIDPTAYGAILNVIAKGESSGNYNAHYSNATNTTVRFTEMPVGEVLRWQEEYVRQGSASSAVGRYQIIRPTLVKLIQELRVDSSALFDEKLQDQMAIALLERRGSLAYAEEKLSREQFAANLAQEWAALPKITGPNPQESYYAGDGINQSRITIDAVYAALDKLKPKKP